MNKNIAAIFSNADQVLHSMINDIDEVVISLKEENKEKAQLVSEHLLKAHAIIHDMDYNQSEIANENGEAKEEKRIR